MEEMTAPIPTLWSDRVASQLLDSGPRTFLECDDACGIQWAIRRLDITNTLTLRIWCEDGFAPLGNILSDAIKRDFGYDLIDAGAPLEQSLTDLHKLLNRVGPVVVILGWFEHIEPQVRLLMHSLPESCKLIVLTKSKGSQLADLGFDRMDNTFLQMRREEAGVAVSDVVSRAAVALAYDESGGKFGAFLQALDALAPDSEVDDFDAGALDYRQRAFQKLDEAILNSLWRNGRSVEAFDLACTNCPEIVPMFVDRAGHRLFDYGAFHYLWDCLNTLPMEVAEHPSVAYWLYAAGAATNRLSEVQELAERVLAKHDAPNLRAAAAVMRPGPNIDSETDRAVGCAETAVTIRARAFSRAMGGDRHAPVLLLRRAMALAENIDANHLVVGCALDLSNQEITLGRLRSGRDWAVWALQQYESRQLAEDYRRQTALSGAAFANLLLGNVLVAGEYISKLKPDVTHIGVPTYESVVSTVGDWHLLTGDPGEAAFFYERNLSRGPLSQYASASLDVVKAKMAAEDYDGALHQAELAHSLSRTSTPLERALGSLGLGMVLSYIDLAGANLHLSLARQALAGTSYLIFESQALLWLAKVQLEQGNSDGARRTLEMASTFTSELSLLGWEYLLASKSLANELTALANLNESSLHLNFLGASSVSVRGEHSRPSMRQCEILAILCDRPDGVSTEQLQLLVFGDNGTIATTKATVSRLRKTVPISAAPYRIEGTVEADFTRLLDKIQEGHLHQALRLYEGPLLPGSEAPGIIELRQYIAECLRYAIMAAGDPDLLIQLGTVLENDLEVWEAAKQSLSSGDRRKPLVHARIRRVKANW